MIHADKKQTKDVNFNNMDDKLNTPLPEMLQSVT